MTSAPPVKVLWSDSTGQQEQRRIRLFCLPYAGAGASIYRTWQRGVSTGIEIVPVQLPGRENRLSEPPFKVMAPLVESLVQTLRPYLDEPFALFGHSIGALISFELARQLRREFGRNPQCLFVSGHGAPQVRDSRLNPSIPDLPEADLLAQLRRLNGTPEAVFEDAEFLQLVLPALRADFSIGARYEYLSDERLICPISAFGGLEDPVVLQKDLLEWHKQTHGRFVCRMLPGNHFFLRNAERLILQCISQDLT